MPGTDSTKRRVLQRTAPFHCNLETLKSVQMSASSASLYGLYISSVPVFIIVTLWAGHPLGPRVWGTSVQALNGSSRTALQHGVCV